MKIRFLLRISAVLACIAAASTVLVRSIPANDHSSHRSGNAGSVARALGAGAQQAQLPPGEPEAAARLIASPRHGEWVVIQSGKNPVTGATDSTRAWVVYPERSTKAPVVVVIHEIFGLTPWIRSVADQLAADGFIAIAPDLLTMRNLPGNPVDGPDRAQATSAIRTVTDEELNRQVDAVAKYAMTLPAAVQKYGVVGFCWGGTASFTHAIHSPSLAASVVYYGSTPNTSLASIRAPVLALYGGNDNRVNATLPRADSSMKALGKSFQPHLFDGAGHGFLRQQSQPAANLEATRKAWPLTIQFFRQHLESR